MITPAALKALAAGDVKNFVAAATPGGIEAQEKAGQIKQSFLDTLPKEMHDDRANFEKLGFVFGKDADDIFIEATFPKGWRKRCTSHDMWSNILDDKGRERGVIFYKAAFYDRCAHCSLSRRFSVTRTYGRGEPVKVFIQDAAGLVDQKVEWLEAEDTAARDDVYFKQRSAITGAEQKLRDWLTANYPDWENVLAYWD